MASFLKRQNYFLFELFLLFRIFANLGPSLASSLLIQDKICLFHYKQENVFCQNLQQPIETVAAQLIKDQILAESGRFASYKSLAETIPLLLWSLFLGPFLDAYPNATFIIFLLSVFGDLIAAIVSLASAYFYETSPYYLLAGSLSVWLSGGNMAFNTTAILYFMSYAPEESRAFKFVVVQVIAALGLAGSTFINGQILRNITGSLQLRTYHIAYWLSLALVAASLVMLMVLYRFNKHHQTTKAKDRHSKQGTVRALLNVTNARQTLYCFFRSRANHLRLQIFILCFIQFSQYAVNIGLANLMVIFSQKVYHWDPTMYSTISAIQKTIEISILAVLSAILINWLHITETSLIFMAQISNFFADLIRGTFLSQTAFYASIFIGCLNGLGIVATKSELSKIIPKDEAGKIFTLTALLEALVPLGTTLVYANIFALSIGKYPGLIYHFSCLLMILTVGAMIIEKRFCPLTRHENKRTSKEMVN